MTTHQGLPTDRELIESYYNSAPNEKDLLHQRDVLAARNPETPESVLRKIMEGAEERVLAGLAGNRVCPHDLIPKILERCAAFDEDGGSWAADYVRRSLAANPFAPSDVIDGLLGAADQETRRAAAANPKASKGELAKVQEDADDDVRLAATANLNGPPPNDAVVRDHDPRVRAMASHRRDAPTDVLAQLGRDQDPSVQQAVAANPNTPPATLEGLAEGGGVLVRKAVAANPNTPPETLTYLAANGDEGVRAAAKGNPNCPAAGRAAAGLLTD